MCELLFLLFNLIVWLTFIRLEILKSWFGLMDEDGWIPREQILGAEARSKVPPEFTIQYPHYANPPTLFIVLEAFLDKLNLKSDQSSEDDPLDSLRSTYVRNPELADAYIRSLYPLLKRHYFWYRNTQRGDIKSYDREAYSTKEGYRWRGRSEQHILTSGIDDYPRAQPPHPGELHVDLISWMGMMTRALRRIAETVGETEDAEEFKEYETAIGRNIDDLHWDDQAQTYCDATIDEFEESIHVCHKGYISIIPFLTGMIGPNNPRLKPTLDLINDPEELWSNYGIRSLSKKDEFYGTSENYWRSPVWVNVNYLVLKNLYVSFSYRFARSGFNLRSRTLRLSLALTRNRPARCTPSCGRTLLKTCSRNGNRRDLPGSSMTQRSARDNGLNTSPAGPAWW